MRRDDPAIWLTGWQVWAEIRRGESRRDVAQQFALTYDQVIHFEHRCRILLRHCQSAGCFA